MRNKHGLFLSFTVGDLDVGKFIQKIIVYRNADNPLSVFEIKVKINQECIKLLREYFKTRPEGTLTIKHYFFKGSPTNQDVPPIDTKTYQLYILNDSSLFRLQADHSKQKSSVQSLDFDMPFTFHAIPIGAIKSSTKIVNKVYEKKTLQEIVEDNITNNLEIVHPFDNTEMIDQVIIPPMSLSRMFNYLDFHFGFYNSDSRIWFTDEKKENGGADTKTKIFSPKKFENMGTTHIKLVSPVHGSEDADKQVQQSMDNLDKYYVNSQDVDFLDERTSFSVLQPYKLVFIQKPMSYIYKTYETNLKEIGDKTGFTDAQFNPKVSDFLKKRYDLLINHTGYEETEYPYDRWFSEMYLPQHSIVLSIDGYVNLNNLIPGYTAEWIPGDVRYKKLQGKYVILNLVTEFGNKDKESWTQKTVIGISRVNVEQQETASYSDLDVDIAVQSVMLNPINLGSNLFGK